MNTSKIEHFLSKHSKAKSIFKGVFPSDRLPKTILNYPALITPVYKKKLMKYAFKETFVFR